MASAYTTTSRTIRPLSWKRFAPCANGIVRKEYGPCSSRDRKPAGDACLNRHSSIRSIQRTRRLSHASLVRARSSRRIRFLQIVLWKEFAAEERMHSHSDRRTKSLTFLAVSCGAATKLSSCRMVVSTTFTTSFWRGFGGTHENGAAALFHHL